MSNFELRELSGFVFTNRDKAGDKHPDMRGECLLNGQPHELALWKREDRSGKPFFSFKLGPKREQAAAQAPARHGAPPPGNDLDDSIPF